MAEDREFHKIRELQWEAYRAGLIRKTAEVAHRGVEQARAVGSDYWRVKFLFGEGMALSELGDSDAAQIALLEATRPTPEADPADQYNALCGLIAIALNERDATYCRRLIVQGYAYLEGVGKGGWRHKLDLLEGQLEFQRGRFEEADRCYRRGWEYQPKGNDYPSYTTAAYLYALIETAFARRSSEAMAHWQAELEGCNKSGEADRDDEQSGRLLLLRALRAPAAGDVGGLDPAALPQALGLLRSQQAYDATSKSNLRIALRVLALAGHWTALDDWIGRLTWSVDGFKDPIFLGDERLCRSRYALGLPLRDDEWDRFLEEEQPPDAATLCSVTPVARDQALAFLAQARARYEGGGAEAQREDERLDTHWYTETLNQRLARVAALEAVAYSLPTA